MISPQSQAIDSLKNTFFYNEFPDIIDAPPFTPVVPARPFNWVTWYKTVLFKDDEGILKKVKTQLDNWREQEKYVRDWDLESTGIHYVPSKSDQKKYIFSNLLKFADQRLVSAAKEAEEGSAIKTIVEVREALHPQIDVRISEEFKFKFKARILQGFATINLINPYFQQETFVDRRGNVRFYASKSITSLGIGSSMLYNLKEGNWSFKIDKKLTDNIVGSIVSNQDYKNIFFSGRSEKIFQINYRYIY